MKGENAKFSCLRQAYIASSIYVITVRFSRFYEICKGSPLYISATIPTHYTNFQQSPKGGPFAFQQIFTSFSNFTKNCKGSPLYVAATIPTRSGISSKVQRGDPLHFNKYSQFLIFYRELQRVPPLHFCYNFNTLHEFPVKCKGGTLCISANINNKKRE